MSDLVCPECGHGSFAATLTTRTEYTYNIDESGHFHEVDETVVDSGDQGDIEQVTCDDCGIELYPEVDPDPTLGNGERCYLVTQEQYDHEPDFEEILETRTEARGEPREWGMGV